MTQKRDEQRDLLDALTRLGSGQAENAQDSYSARWFLPLPEHLRALDPDIVLVVGDRGAGKSHLFRSVFTDGLLEDIAAAVPSIRLPEGGSTAAIWQRAFPLEADFPDQRGLTAHLKGAGMQPDAALDLWFAYLVRVVAPQFDAIHRATLGPMLGPAGGDIGAVLAAFRSLGNAPLLALDALDRNLQAKGGWLFVGYDELDTVAGFDWAAMALAIRGLVAFWAGYARRWKRLRAKLFLRSDLFRRHAGLGGGDLAKLASNRAEITWSDRTLWAMLVKRIANTREELAAYCRRARIRFSGDASEPLGLIPVLSQAGDASALVDRLAGTYMGANVKKGHTFTWMLDHLRDGRGRITPRTLVQLVEQAAMKERDAPRQSPPRLLHPISLRQALEDVSKMHVTQALDEWPWLYGVKSRVSSKPLVPWDRSDLAKRLETKWKSGWGERGDVVPPLGNAEELIDYLVELGVLRERKVDGRIDVPDLYLFGLGLRRKGGVATK